MATISLPSYPPAPQSVEWSVSSIVAVSVSPFTGNQQVQDWQGGWLEASVSMPPLNPIKARQWIGALAKARGQANSFLFGDPLDSAPAGVGTGTPVVSGASNAGYTLATSGWTGSVTGILLAGDRIQVGQRLYILTDDANSDGGGAASLKINVPLRETPTAGTAIIVNYPVGLFRLKTNTAKWSETLARYYGLQFELREAI